jgi:hypothetical protein
LCSSETSVNIYFNAERNNSVHNVHLYLRRTTPCRLTLVADVTTDHRQFVPRSPGRVYFWASISKRTDILTLSIKVLQFFEMFKTSYQSARRHVPEDMNLYEHCCVDLKSRRCSDVPQHKPRLLFPLSHPVHKEYEDET